MGSFNCIFSVCAGTVPLGAVEPRSCQTKTQIQTCITTVRKCRQVDEKREPGEGETSEKSVFYGEAKPQHSVFVWAGRATHAASSRLCCHPIRSITLSFDSFRRISLPFLAFLFSPTHHSLFIGSMTKRRKSKGWKAPRSGIPPAPIYCRYPRLS